MKKTILLTAIYLTLPLSLSAENLNELNQLLSTQKCPLCDLSGSGLVLSNLTGAELQGANLTNANLSQANLTNADLSDADLRGASLYRANLTNANLSNAKMEGADLRQSYLYNANLVGVNLETAYVEGAMGIPVYAASKEQFQKWGLAESQKGNYQKSIDHFNRALHIDPQFASAYLGRSLSQYYLGKEIEAYQDLQMAAQLYQSQNNTKGYEITMQLYQGMQAASQSTEVEDPGPDVLNFINGLAGLALQFLLF